MANGYRYSGPAIAAGAISKAIGDMLEGMLAGERGGLAAEKAIGEMGLAEREQALKQAAFPYELALSRAQAEYLGELTKRTAAEAARTHMLAPEEAGQLRAETGRAGAQTEVYRQQATEAGFMNRLYNQAIADWEVIRDNALQQNRNVTPEEQIAWLRRHPVLMAGPQKIPAAALLDLNQLELWLKQLQAERAVERPYEGPKFLLDVQKQAHGEAESLVKALYGTGVPSPEAADAQAWLTAAARNNLLQATGLPEAKALVRSPGQAPAHLRNLVLARLRQEHPDEKYDTLLMWANEILRLVGEGETTWQAAFANLLRMRQPQEAPRQGPTRQGATGQPPGQQRPNYRYNPGTGEFQWPPLLP